MNDIIQLTVGVAIWKGKKQMHTLRLVIKCVDNLTGRSAKSDEQLASLVCAAESMSIFPIVKLVYAVPFECIASTLCEMR